MAKLIPTIPGPSPSSTKPRGASSTVACPKCGHNKASTLDSRPGQGDTHRRRKQCVQCGERFITVELREDLVLTPLQINTLAREQRAILDQLRASYEAVRASRAFILSVNKRGKSNG